jgi:DNA-binding winged helix-turn-helix (wHTH) protein
MHTDQRLRVTIRRLRSRLEPYGIDVLAVRGLGYKITDEGRRILEEKFGDKISAAKFTKPVTEYEGVS